MITKSDIELSIILPCKNEENTVGKVIKGAFDVCNKENIKVEIIIVLSKETTDASPKIAKDNGAEIFYQENKGYGDAYLKGFEEANGKYIITMDADGQHDSREITKFYNCLKNENYDFVVGARFKKNSVKSTSFINQYIGNPILAKTLNILFHANFSDVMSGYRGFTRDAVKTLDLKCKGMELTPEILIKVSKKGLRVKEIPIKTNLRVYGEPELNPLRDGWRSFRFMFLFAPNWLFLIPGTIFSVIGLFLIFSILFGSLKIFGLQLDTHPMIFGAFLTIIGLQTIIFGLQSKIYSKSIGLGNESKTLKFIDKYFTLEKGTVIGLTISFIGIAILIYIFNTWLTVGFVQQINLMLAGMTLTVLGIQIIFSSWFLSMIGIEKR
ncbi:putative glycosyltransferase [groundwater metagenome]|uniref:Putative glycosyltransferase n=1 Tax=groundwater metagenome TaxID=717931 RepID=A0A098EEC6_9ZZZZ